MERTGLSLRSAALSLLVAAALLARAAPAWAGDQATLHLIAADENAKGALVHVDGLVKGGLPLDLPLPAGRHLVEVKKPGFKEWSRWYELRADSTRDIDVLLVPAGPAAPAPAAAPAPPAVLPTTGSVSVQSSPTGAQVFVDETPRGTAPMKVEGLTPGPHEVVVQQGTKQARQQVVVQAGQDVSVSLTIGAAPVPPPVPAPVPPPVATPAAGAAGTLTVSAMPAVAGALVYIDGQSKGPAPWAGSVSAGGHQIEVRAPGQVCEAQAVVIQPGAEARVVVPLRPEAKEGVEAPERAAGPLNSTLVMAISAFGGSFDAIGEGTVNDQDLFKSDLPDGEDLDRSNRGLGLRFTSGQSPHFGFGLELRTFFWDSDDGGDSDTVIDMSPVLKLRYPLAVGRLEHEVYAVGSGGVSVGILGKAGEDGTKAAQMDVEDFAIGWNAGLAAGAIFRFTPSIGLFLEGGWQVHSLAFGLNKYKGNRVEDGKIGERYRQLTVSTGLALFH